MECAEQGVYYLHVFPRWLTRGGVNNSPFAVKLETWFRMQGIKYQPVFTTRSSSQTGQIPYLVLDGKEYPDSGSIISMVAERHNIRDSDGLSAEQRGVARSVTRLMDEIFCVTYFLYRYSYHPEQFRAICRFVTGVFPAQFLDGLVDKLHHRGEVMGIGRHGEKHVMESGCDDLRALSDILGDKLYMLGDTPHVVDSSVFGHLSQILYNDIPYPYKALLAGECNNLTRYCERIKATYWPDWEDILQKADVEHANHPDRVTV